MEIVDRCSALMLTRGLRPEWSHRIVREAGWTRVPFALR